MHPIAIIGMGCRFPKGASDPGSLWELLRSGTDAVGEVPPDRWRMDDWYDPEPEAPGRTYCRHGSFLDEIDQFDPLLFGMSPREAASLDPQQRLLLEVAHRALEDAAIAPDRLRRSKTGVFVGICADDWQSLAWNDPRSFDPYTGPGASRSMAAGRVAYVFGLQGPALQIDTSCSSSLVAVHLAISSLRNGECRLALAGGAHVMLSPIGWVLRSKLRALSASGRCRAFDADADGFVPGEGAGMVVLKRLDDALADRDRIVAVIRGSAINHDGPSNGLTAPNQEAQEIVLRDALADAALEPERIGYLEAHGTGTKLGDPIEIGALETIHCDRKSELFLGSAKASFGHLEGAAGILSLMKAALALSHATVPPLVHLRRPNPHIEWERLPFRLPTEAIPWPSSGAPRCAGVSSFGMSGTNVHVILEEAPAIEAERTTIPSPHALFLSARTPAGLQSLAWTWAEHLRAHPELELSDLCHTVAVGRPRLKERLAVVARSSDDAIALLEEAAQDRVPRGAERGSGHASQSPEVAFLFTGQGSAWAGMGKELLVEPVFRTTVERIDAALQTIGARAIGDLLSSGEAPKDPERAQLLLFSLELGLAELWRSIGVEPAAVLGHSLGEIGAACFAGILSLEDAVDLVYTRARLLRERCREGVMVALDVDEARAAPAVARYSDRASIAAINSDDSVVIAGEREAVDAIAASLGERGRTVGVGSAFHSPLIDPMLEQLREESARFGARAPQIEIVSSLTGAPIQGALAPDHWVEHARRPVRFADGVRSLVDLDCDVFLEIGPGSTLVSLARRTTAEGTFVPSLAEGAGIDPFVRAIAVLFAAGAPVDPARLCSRRGRKVPVPYTPQERRRCWRDGIKPPAPR